MLTNAIIKRVVSLKNKKFRQQYNCFVVEGRKMTEEALKSKFEVLEIFALNSWIDKNKNLLSAANTSYSAPQVYAVSEKELTKMSSLVNADSVICVIKQKEVKSIETNKKFVIALDNINNPGNLGTIIRLAAWFGIKDIVCSMDTVECYNPKVIQSTMGAIFHTNIIYTDLKKFIEQHYSNNIYGTLPEGGKNIYTEELAKEGIIIIGSESHGISKEIQQIVTNPITIPSFAINDAVESLNASIACGIILSEFRRRF